METTTASITKLETKLKGLKDKEIKLNVKMDNINDLDGNFRSARIKAVNELDKIDKKAEQVGNNVRKNMGSLSIGDWYDQPSGMRRRPGVRRYAPHLYPIGWWIS